MVEIDLGDDHHVRCVISHADFFAFSCSVVLFEETAKSSDAVLPECEVAVFVACVLHTKLPSRKSSLFLHLSRCTWA